MSKRTKINFSKFFTNNWVITLSATLIGVFLALYLNEWVASKNLQKQKSIATQNILAEIESNQNKLENIITDHSNLLNITVFFSTYFDEEDNLIAPSDSMQQFKRKYPSLITIKDSTLLDNGYYKYTGETHFNVALPNLQLTTIAWSTLKNSGYSTSYGFECLMHLETIEMVIHEVFRQNTLVLEYISGEKDSGTKNEALIRQLEFLIGYEKSLLSAYSQSESILKNCSK
jgi:hypothetical protein